MRSTANSAMHSAKFSSAFFLPTSLIAAEPVAALMNSGITAGSRLASAWPTSWLRVNCPAVKPPWASAVPEKALATMLIVRVAGV